MTNAQNESLGNGITLIDTGMIRDGLAACYLLQHDGAAAIIETGTNHTVPLVLDVLRQNGLQPEQVKYVIPTHVHLDHAGGVGGLMQALPNATLVIHPRGARHMIEPEKLKAGVIAVYGKPYFEATYGDIIPVDEARVSPAEDGTVLDLNGRSLEIFDTPGHAKHHFCIYDAASNGVFTGDTFGVAYRELTNENGPFILPTTTPVQFDPEALKQSIHKILSYSPRSVYLTHYGAINGLEVLAQKLIRQIDAYVRLTREALQSDSADQETELTQALTDYTLERLEQHGCDLGIDQQERLIAMDMRLNSQGLLTWANKDK